MKRAIASGAAVVGIATAAMGAGIATQDPVANATPAAVIANPFVFTCPVCGETWLKNQDGARQLELHTEIEHPDLWAKIVGGGR